MSPTPEERARAHRLRGLADMAGGMAHEFNQPLTIIRGAAENLLIARQRGWELPPGRIESKLETILAQCDRISGLIDRVRTFAGGATSPALEPTDPDLAIDDAVAFMTSQLASRGIGIERTRGDGQLALANRHVLAEVVLELLRNARDAILRTAASRGAIAISVTRLADGVAIAICDSGPGLTADQIDSIFDPFNPQRPASAAGPGLGLPSARHAIAGIGGSLEVSSPPGRGALARIILPGAGDA